MASAEQRGGGPNFPTASEEMDSSVGSLFLGIAVPDHVRDGLLAQLGGQHLPGRRVPPRNWHLTLVYLGRTSRREMGRLKDALLAEELGRRAAITLGGMGAFPDPGRASVLWIGVAEGAGAIRALNARVRSAVRRAGLAVEERHFVPHLTLSRIRPPHDVLRYIERGAHLTQDLAVDAVILFRSNPGAGSVTYQELARFELG